MDTKIVFLRRTKKEIEIFGGEVFIDLDGKNIGILGLQDFIITLKSGVHNIKMYKSHTYNTFIGNAEVEITVNNGEDLLIKYSPPMIVNQKGHIVVSDFNSFVEVESLVKEKEKIITNDDNNAKQIKLEQEEKSRDSIIIFVIIMVICMVIYWVVMESAFNYTF